MVPDSSTVCLSPSCIPPPVLEETAPLQVPSSLLSQRPKASSLSSSCPSTSTFSGLQPSSLGQRRKGLGRKVRRNHRARGRTSGPPASRDADRKTGKDERMEEDDKMEEEQMEAESAAKE